MLLLGLLQLLCFCRSNLQPFIKVRCLHNCSSNCLMQRSYLCAMLTLYLLQLLLKSTELALLLQVLKLLLQAAELCPSLV
jgi:hypothetical protein